MATLRITTRPRKDKMGRVPIYISIEHQGKTLYTALGIKIIPKHFNRKAQRISQSNPRHIDLNAFLVETMAKAENAILDLKRLGLDFTAEEAQNRVKTTLGSAKTNTNIVVNSWSDFNRGEVERYRQMGKYGASRKHFGMANRLHDFVGTQDIPFSILDRRFMIAYKDYRLKLGKHLNSITLDLKTLKTELYRADELGYYKMDVRIIFKGLSENVPSTSVPLTIEEVRRIEELELTGNIAMARDAFLFSLYAQGMRFGDVASIRWENVVDGLLVYNTNKSSRAKLIKIPIHKKMRAILDNYERKQVSKYANRIFPFILGRIDETANAEQMIKFKESVAAKNAVINRLLKLVAKHAGISKNLTFHMARHTFTNLAIAKMDIRQVQTALAHSSVKTTEIYLKTMEQAMDENELGSLF